jgi:hypothetical protein
MKRNRIVDAFFVIKKSTVLNSLGGSSLGDLMHDVEFAIMDTCGQETGPDNFALHNT